MRNHKHILLFSLALGLLFWVVDAVADYYWFYDATLIETLITNVPPHEIYIRGFALILFFAFGFIVSKLLHQRNLVESSLNKKEAQYARAQAIARFGSWQIDLNNKSVFGSEEARRIYGLGEAALTFSDIRKIPLPEYRPMLNEALEGLIRRNRPYDIEFKIRRASDGAILDVHSVAEFEPEENVVYGTIHDVTQKKKTEAALQESEQKYRFITENISDIILACDTKGIYTYVSPSHKRILGRGESVIGRSVFEHIHPDDIEQTVKTFEKGLSSRQEESAEYRYLHPARGYIWLESAGKLNVEADPAFSVIITSRDITQRKNAEAALAASESKFRSIFDFSYQAIALTEIETGRIIDVNAMFCNLTGYAKNEVLEKTTTDLGFYSEADRRRFLDELEAAGKVNDLEMDFFTKDGSVLNALMFARNITIGDSAYLLTMFVNLTEQKRLESQLRQAHKMEAIGRLAGGVAHDFNNMLNIILGYAEIALSELPPQSPLHQNITEINSAAQRSTDLVRQLLAFSRKQAIEPRILNLNQALTEHGKMLDRLIGDHIDSRLLLAEDLWQIRIDPSQIGQIIANLAVNARDAIAETGTITIKTANVTIDETATDMDTEAPAGDYVMLVFSDTGHGMGAETLEQIFEPFFTTKPKDKGTGLGLATVYGIVKQNKGIIKVSSEPGTGATFSIYFPRHEAAADEVSEEADEKMPTGNETVLIVEDQEQVLNLAATVLEKSGYRVYTANSPEAALAVCRETDDEIHLLLTDVMMPKMNGKQLKAEIEALRPGIKALFMSGYTESIMNPDGEIDENLNFVQKPFSIRTLAEKVRTALDR